MKKKEKAMAEAPTESTKEFRVKTLIGYQKEFKKYNYRCRWCLPNKPAELGSIQLYPHDGGWKIALQEPTDAEYCTNEYSWTPEMWIYATCLNCNYEWALWKLRREYAYPGLGYA